MVRILSRSNETAHRGYASSQSDMEVMDEKVNGGPPLEVEEIVSVTDRACRSSYRVYLTSNKVVFSRRSIRGQAYARSRA